MKTTTADLIKVLRDTHRLSQTEIAKRTGIPQPRLSRWESGSAPTGADDALKLRALVDQLGEQVQVDPTTTNAAPAAEQGASHA